jgi:hypothetical protein
MWIDLTGKPFNLKLTLYCTACNIDPQRSGPRAMLFGLTPLI